MWSLSTPARCVPIPGGCTDGVPCRCLDVRKECLGVTGMCATAIGSTTQALFCTECS